MTHKEQRKVNGNDEDQRNNRIHERPDRPEPDTMEGPGGGNEANAGQDAVNKSTRKRER